MQTGFARASRGKESKIAEQMEFAHASVVKKAKIAEQTPKTLSPPHHVKNQ